MKRFKKIVTAALISISLISVSAVFAQGWGGGNANRTPRYAQQQQFNPGPGRVLRSEMFEARIEVLAELAGQSKEDIRAKIQYKPMWAVLDDYKVDYSDFQSKMHDKTSNVVKQAVADGKITQDQADVMLKRMEDGPFGPRSGMRGQGRGYGKGRGFCGYGQQN
ncbi:hypothetical protein KJ966_06880 [bacterium]|nr:hypothetical protein [bacterium]